LAVTPTGSDRTGKPTDYVTYHASYVIYHLMSTAASPSRRGQVRFLSAPTGATRAPAPVPGSEGWNLPRNNACDGWCGSLPAAGFPC